MVLARRAYVKISGIKKDRHEERSFLKLNQIIVLCFVVVELVLEQAIDCFLFKNAINYQHISNDNHDMFLTGLYKHTIKRLM